MRVPESALPDPLVLSWRILHERPHDLLLGVNHVLEDGSIERSYVEATDYLGGWAFVTITGEPLSGSDQQELAEDLDRYLGYSHENQRYMEWRK